ncbi:MAG: DUF4276 family protein [Candidatus Sulfotelmatobacter sp.]
MPRLLVHVEGQTEETFVNEVLRNHLAGIGYESVSARILGNARLRRRRGGIRPWPSARRDIVNHLRQDPGCTVTTMVDFYALPRQGESAWPGRADAAGFPGSMQKASHVQEALLEDITGEMGPNFNIERFIPFVIMHEFEGILFSDCSAFSRAIGRAELASVFQNIRDGFGTPEDINDSPETCPSNRVIQLVAGYEKPLLGTLAVLEIGLHKIRQECPLFNDWVSRLESLAA